MGSISPLPHKILPRLIPYIVCFLLTHLESIINYDVGTCQLIFIASKILKRIYTLYIAAFYSCLYSIYVHHHNITILIIICFVSQLRNRWRGCYIFVYDDYDDSNNNNNSEIKLIPLGPRTVFLFFFLKNSRVS